MIAFFAVVRGNARGTNGAFIVIPVKTGIQASYMGLYGGLDSGFRRNDEDEGLYRGLDAVVLRKDRNDRGTLAGMTAIAAVMAWMPSAEASSRRFQTST